jgi:hypothetical protein
VRTSPQSMQSVGSGVVGFFFDFPHRQTINSTVRHSRPDSFARSRSENFSAVLEMERKKNFPSRLATSFGFALNPVSHCLFLGYNFATRRPSHPPVLKIKSPPSRNTTRRTTLLSMRGAFLANGKCKEKRKELCRSASEKQSPATLWIGKRNLRRGESSWEKLRPQAGRVFQRGTSRRRRNRAGDQPDGLRHVLSHASLSFSRENHHRGQNLAQS